MPNINILDWHSLLFKEFRIQPLNELQFGIFFINLIDRQSIVIFRHKNILSALNPLRMRNHSPIFIMVVDHWIVSLLRQDEYLIRREQQRFVFVLVSFVNQCGRLNLFYCEGARLVESCFGVADDQDFVHVLQQKNIIIENEDLSVLVSVWGSEWL